jgi:branched-chain amino acid transport system ATP-binding protein
MSWFQASLGSAGYGRLQVLGALDLAVNGGEMLVVLGSNGAGKTTALRAIIGAVASHGRQVFLDGNDLSKLQPYMLPSLGVSLVPDGARCFPNLTVLDNLRGAYVAASGQRELPAMESLLEEIYGYFPILRERQDQTAGTMSGGQRQMLAVGRALMTAPRALLLDEPSAGLAPKIVEELFGSLAEIKRHRGCAVVMAEQNVGYATQIADHCIVLKEGRVTLIGSMAEVVKRDELRGAYLGL